MVEEDPYAGALTARDGMLYFWLLQTDYGLPGINIGFARDAAGRTRFEKDARTWESQRVGSDFARSLIFRRRGNVVFYYEQETATEVVRIAQGCLGGPAYRGNGGTPPRGGLSPPGGGGTPVPIPLG